MAKRMSGNTFTNFCILYSPFYRNLHMRFVKMIPPYLLCIRNGGEFFRLEKPLPDQFFRAVFILFFNGIKHKSAIIA